MSVPTHQLIDVIMSPQARYLRVSQLCFRGHTRSDARSLVNEHGRVAEDSLVGGWHKVLMTLIVPIVDRRCALRVVVLVERYCLDILCKALLRVLSVSSIVESVYDHLVAIRSSSSDARNLANYKVFSWHQCTVR